MENKDILAYLSQFDKFSASKIQRKFKWGYIRAIKKIVELVDLGLIIELPNEMMAFKVSTSNVNLVNLNKESFQKTLDDREPIKPIKPISIKKTVRIWFEPTDDDYKLKPIEMTPKIIDKLIIENASKKIMILNSSSRIRLHFRLNSYKNKNVRFGKYYSDRSTPSAVVVITKSYDEIKTIKKAIRSSVEKIYIIGNKNILTKYQKTLRK